MKDLKKCLPFLPASNVPLFNCSAVLFSLAEKFKQSVHRQIMIVAERHGC